MFRTLLIKLNSSLLDTLIEVLRLNFEASSYLVQVVLLFLLFSMPFLVPYSTICFLLILFRNFSLVRILIIPLRGKSNFI